MDKVETIEDLYKRKFDLTPPNQSAGVGHFNIFQIEDYIPSKGKPLPYKRRDYYKATLVIGNDKVHYADKVIEVKKQALIFSNPFIPYQWEHAEGERSGYFAVFNQSFFYHFGNLNEYSVFQPGGKHIFELTDEQMSVVKPIFEKMWAEINSDYTHKYDVLRTLMFEALHFAMKTVPEEHPNKQPVNASTRISTLFSELLERQFPIDDAHQTVQLRTASDFAAKLNIHVNHLNRAVKETTQKTTTQIISERILQEAKILLKHSAWSVSEIAYALGFTEPTHFNNFFKKYTETSPLKFRNV